MEGIEGASDSDEKESVVFDTPREILVLEKAVVLNTEAVVGIELIQFSVFHFNQESLSY